MRYYTSDPHFGHERIIPLCDRPFRDTHHMNRSLIENINETCEPDDDLHILGDVIMGKFLENITLLAELRPRLHLVSGNHDRIHPAYRSSDAKRAEHRAMYEVYFETVTVESKWMALGPDKVRVQLNHFPYEGDSHDEDRYLDLRPVDEGLPLLCGHVHGAWRTRGRQFNVGVDVNDFRPVSEATLIEWVASLD